ncbi:hypothetical protein E0500_029790 [Streptomyces sp. KM273126]|uniref:hypothetical protein n=1 Tax=Streptomyces sp. KM273126 TaxID=2545247 RepID=UPI0014052150|nr:hypothetical protein [Streptomyces sp. KM273126]MBA2811430.1 hypothetical protein [Streptomyces sp. KM273126]
MTAARHGSDDDDPGAAVTAGAARQAFRLALRRDRGRVADRIVQQAVGAASGWAGAGAVLGAQALLDTPGMLPGGGLVLDDLGTHPAVPAGRPQHTGLAVVEAAAPAR